MSIIFHLCYPSVNIPLFWFSFLLQPHTLFSLVSLQLAQGNVTGALALFRHILVTALSSSASFVSLAECKQCRTSLPLLRCLQFYPFLYNLSQRQPCSGKRIAHTQTYLSCTQKYNGLFLRIWLKQSSILLQWATKLFVLVMFRILRTLGKELKWNKLKFYRFSVVCKGLTIA